MFHSKVAMKGLGRDNNVFSTTLLICSLTLYSLVGFVIPLKFYVYFSEMDFSSSTFNEESENHRDPV